MYGFFIYSINKMKKRLLFICIFMFIFSSFLWFVNAEYQVSKRIKTRIDGIMSIVDYQRWKKSIDWQITRYQQVINSFSMFENKFVWEQREMISYMLHLFKMKFNQLKDAKQFNSLYARPTNYWTNNTIVSSSQTSKEVKMWVWVWHNNLLDDTALLISNLKEHNITQIFVQYSSHRTIQDYKNIVSMLNSKNIKVYLLDWDPNWIYPNKRVWLDSLLSFYNTYQSQASSNEKFYKLRLDIEPWSLSEWSTNRDYLIFEYQSLVNNVLQSIWGKNNLSLDIPFWFDEIEYHNSFWTWKLFDYLANIVSELTLMSYRNKFEWTNGIKDIISYEVAHNQKNKNYILNVWLETYPSSEWTHISFYWLWKDYFLNELNLLNTYLQNYSNIWINIHYYNYFLDLVQWN